jgi:hypothetical protein
MNTDMGVGVGVGVIQGGWAFVWAAYAVSAAILTGYAASVVVRYRALASRRQRERGQAVRP